MKTFVYLTIVCILYWSASFRLPPYRWWHYTLQSKAVNFRVSTTMRYPTITWMVYQHHHSPSTAVSAVLYRDAGYPMFIQYRSLSNAKLYLYNLTLETVLETIPHKLIIACCYDHHHRCCRRPFIFSSTIHSMDVNLDKDRELNSHPKANNTTQSNGSTQLN